MTNSESIQNTLKKGVLSNKLPLLFYYAKVKEISLPDEAYYRTKKVIKIPSLNTERFFADNFYRPISKFLHPIPKP